MAQEVVLFFALSKYFSSKNFCFQQDYYGIYMLIRYISVSGSVWRIQQGFELDLGNSYGFPSWVFPSLLSMARMFKSLANVPPRPGSMSNMTSILEEGRTTMLFPQSIVFLLFLCQQCVLPFYFNLGFQKTRVKSHHPLIRRHQVSGQEHLAFSQGYGTLGGNSFLR